MTLALRRTVFLDGESRLDDYEVRHDAGISVAFIGRAAPAGNCGSRPRSAGGCRMVPMAGWPIAWTRPRRRSGRRGTRMDSLLSLEKADEKCLGDYVC
jgi:hypothetical protein